MSYQMAVIGFWEVALMLGVLMIFFGAKKLPQLARGLGSGIRNFKGELSAPAAESLDEGDPRHLQDHLPLQV